MRYESEYLTLDLAVALGTGEYCDLVGGDQISGGATLAVGPGSNCSIHKSRKRVS